MPISRKLDTFMFTHKEFIFKHYFNGDDLLDKFPPCSAGYENYVLIPLRSNNPTIRTMGWMYRIIGSGARHPEKPVQPTKIKGWWKGYLHHSLN